MGREAANKASEGNAVRGGPRTFNADVVAMKQTVRTLSALVFVLCAAAGLGAPEKERGAVSVRSYWAREVFDWNNSDPLRDHRVGDTAVMTVSVREGAVMHYGHRGKISYLTVGDTGELDSLLRGRFMVKEVDGEKRLVLDQEFSRMSTTGLLAQAASDYNSLLPTIAGTSVPEGSRLVLRRLSANDGAMHVVCPPEGWRTLYVAVRQADRRYRSDTMFRYEYTGRVYMLVECATAQYYQGE